MIQLPKVKRKANGKTCKCVPFCKNRRREWKGVVQKTSAELLQERRPQAECHQRYPHRVFPNSPCPLFARKSQIKVQPLGLQPPQSIVRVCQAPLDLAVDTTYLHYVELAKKIGASKLVRNKTCAFCTCGKCCCCKHEEYKMTDADRSRMRTSHMRTFDARVLRDREKNSMRIMYGKSMCLCDKHDNDYVNCGKTFKIH